MRRSSQSTALRKDDINFTPARLHLQLRKRRRRRPAQNVSELVERSAMTRAPKQSCRCIPVQDAVKVRTDSRNGYYFIRSKPHDIYRLSRMREEAGASLGKAFERPDADGIRTALFRWTGWFQIFRYECQRTCSPHSGNGDEQPLKKGSSFHIQGVVNTDQTIKMTRIIPIPSAVAPPIYPHSLACLLGGPARRDSSWPLSLRRSYSSGRSSLNRSSGKRPLNITISIGKDSGRRWVWKKWNTKMNPTASSASSLWTIFAMFKT